MRTHYSIIGIGVIPSGAALPVIYTLQAMKNPPLRRPLAGNMVSF